MCCVCVYAHKYARVCMYVCTCGYVCGYSEFGLGTESEADAAETKTHVHFFTNTDTESTNPMIPCTDDPLPFNSYDRSHPPPMILSVYACRYTLYSAVGTSTLSLIKDTMHQYILEVTIAWMIFLEWITTAGPSYFACSCCELGAHAIILTLTPS